MYHTRTSGSRRKPIRRKQRIPGDEEVEEAEPEGVNLEGEVALQPIRRARPIDVGEHHRDDAGEMQGERGDEQQDVDDQRHLPLIRHRRVTRRVAGGRLRRDRRRWRRRAASARGKAEGSPAGGGMSLMREGLPNRDRRELTPRLAISPPGGASVRAERLRLFNPHPHGPGSGQGKTGLGEGTGEGLH